MTGGDGMNGLATAILVVSLVVIAGGGLLFWVLARRLTVAGKGGVGARSQSLGGKAIQVGLVLLGLGVGYLVVIGTFREDLVNPAPEVRLFPPPGYKDVRMIVLEDPVRGQPLKWKGGGGFEPRHADLQVPDSGIIRIRALRPEESGSANLNLTWGKNGEGGMNGGSKGPPGTGARAYYIVERVDAWANGPPPQLPEDPVALGAYILAREAAYSGK